MSKILLLPLSAVLSASVPALAGPAWVEPGDEDAGSLPGDAQFTAGEGELQMIAGVLGGAGGAAALGGDFEDMFVIFIAEPGEFSATTAFAPGGAEFDSRLFLFDIGGLGLLGNDETSVASALAAGEQQGACCFPDGTCEVLFPSDCDKLGGTFAGGGLSCEDVSCPIEGGSTLGNSSTDGTGVVITEPGLYLLAITVTPRFPESNSGPIFFFADSTEVSGPDGSGGGGPITEWDEPIPLGLPGIPGEYVILLTGTTFAEPETDLLLSLDIRPGGCPNPLNRSAQGFLPVALPGTADFDVADVDLASLALVRADGEGGMAFPNEGPPGPHTVINQVATPFDGEPCDCAPGGGDGIPDLSMKFRVPDLVEALQLEGLPAGELVELVLTGELTDGTTFQAADCVRLVPPQTPGPMGGPALAR